MPGEIISANMNLVLPGVGVTLGPQWASDLNTSLNIIDSHNHTAGSGVPINPSGLDIISDLNIKNNNLIQIRSLNMAVQTAPLALAADIGCLYVSGVDLWFNDEDGTQIQITQNGGIAGSPGSISNLTSPASASYVSGSQTFVWQSDVNTSANMDFASATLRNLTASSFGLTLSPPTLSSNYTITLPTLPASTKILSINSSGNIGAVYGVDESTLTIDTNVIKVKDAGITATQLASDAVTTAKILDANVTRAKLAAVGQVLSTTSGTFTTRQTTPQEVCSRTLTTTGRPVMVMVQPLATSTNSGFIMDRVAAGTTALGNIEIYRDSTLLGTNRIGQSNSGEQSYYPASISFLDVPAAGTYTYRLKVYITTDGEITVQDCVLVAYEL